MGPHSGGGRVVRGRNWTKTMTISFELVRTPDGKHRVDGGAASGPMAICCRPADPSLTYKDTRKWLSW